MRRGTLIPKEGPVVIVWMEENSVIPGASIFVYSGKRGKPEGLKAMPVPVRRNLARKSPDKRTKIEGPVSAVPF